MKPASSLPHSQQPATCPCPQPDQSYSGPIYVRSTLISFSHLCLRLPSGMSFGFRHLSNPPFSSTCHAHLIPSENPLQTRYPQQRVAVLSGAEAANSIRNTLRETEYQSCNPKFHRLVYAALPVLGMPRLSAIQVNPLATRTCLDGRCWRVSWRRHV